MDEQHDDKWGSGVRFVPAQRGTRMVSVRALVERAAEEFHHEYGSNHPVVREAVSRVDRLKLVREVVLYIVGVESVQLEPRDMAALIEETYAELFGYGLLDRLLTDERVTTITFDGLDKVAARFGFANLEPQERIFEEPAHMARMLERMLRDGDAELRDDIPYYEVGILHEGRRLCVNMVLPPVTNTLNGYIRVHPRTPPTLDSFTSSADAIELLTAIARSPHGVIVVGESESGKTSLLAALIRTAGPTDAVAVERAGEMSLPDDVKRLRVQWPVGDRPFVSFGHRILQALDQHPHTIILDEVRADEPEAVLHLLGDDAPARQLWAFRGATEVKRLVPALGMLARRADYDQATSDARVLTLHRRLPFVVTVRRRQEHIKITSIAEWQFLMGEHELPSLVELMTQGWDGLERTQKDVRLPL
jgi:type IV secretory pathway ATPase VirB11/archaellum biosynthesis ATPase